MNKEEVLKKIKERLASITEERMNEKNALEQERKDLITSIGSNISDMLSPALMSLAENAQMTKQDLRDAISQALSELNISVPEINIPEIKIPTINVPEVKLPTINVPQTKVVMPDSMTVKGEVDIKGVSKSSPFPVMMMGPDGKPMSFSQAISGGGGKADFFTIVGIQNTVGVVTINPDGSPVYNSGSALGTVSVSDIFGTVGTNVVNPDGRLKVELPTGSSGLTDTELRASAVPVAQVSGVGWSVFATNPVDNGDSATALRVVIAGNSSASVSATQSGTWNIGTVTTVTGVTNSISTALVDSSGVQYSGSNPVPVTGNVVVSSITSSTQSALIDSTGVQYSGSNPVPTTVVSGALSSSASGYTRQTNPTAIASDYAPLASDDLGRQLVRPIQVRDLIKTAYVTTSTGVETTFITATAGAFLDCIMLTATNASTASVTVDIRAGTAGNIVHTMVLPASTGPIGWSPTVPWPQDATGNSWTVDVQGSDISNTNVYFSGLFSQEI